MTKKLKKVRDLVKRYKKYPKRVPNKRDGCGKRIPTEKRINNPKE